MKMKIIAFAITLSLLLSGMLVAVGGRAREAREIVDEGIEETGLQAFQVIHDWTDLNNMRNNLSGNYILKNDLDENTSGYEQLVNTTDGWEPIGDDDSPFTGTFDGNGFVISDLYIDRSKTDFVGLFGYIDVGSEVTRIGLVDANVSGSHRVGGLIGRNHGTVKNSSAKGKVSGTLYVGGLIGENSIVKNSYTTAEVSGGHRVGGLVGINIQGPVSNSYATGNVSGYNWIGGLVGDNFDGEVSNSYATGDVSGDEDVGGLVGNNTGLVSDSFSLDSPVIGMNQGTNKGRVTDAIKSEMKDYPQYTQISYPNYTNLQEPWDFVGDQNNDTSDEDIWGIDKNGIINDGYPFLTWRVESEIYDWYDLDEVRYDLDRDYVLMNDLDEDTAGYEDLVNTTDGWEPIGDWDVDNDVEFYGTFDGNGHEISGLYIDRPRTDEVGLFGCLSWKWRNDDNNITKKGTDEVGPGGFISSTSQPPSIEGEVTDVRLINTAVTGNNRVGALVGQNYGTVKNSSVKGKVSGSNSVGGLIGKNAMVKNSYATVEVSGGERVGGLVGRNIGPVSNSYSTGEVSGNGRVGGLVGYNEDNIVNNSYARGIVSGEWLVGGLVGENGFIVNNSYATGDISGEEGKGALVGRNLDGGLVVDSFSLDSPAIGINQGKIQGRVTDANKSEMKDYPLYTQISYSGYNNLFEPWDFIDNPNNDTVNEDIWDIDEYEEINDGYPFLTWEDRMTTKPSKPQNLQASAGDEQVELTWDAPSDNGGSSITEYKIYRDTTSGSLSYHDRVNGSTTTYTDKGLTNGQTYYYRVSAVNNVGEGDRSSEVSATPSSDLTPSSVPEDLQASSGDGQLDLTWDAPSEDGGSSITEYKIYRGTSSGALTFLTSVTSTSYTDQDVENDQTYYYKVSAVNSAGEGDKSSEVSATPSSDDDQNGDGGISGFTATLLLLSAVIAVAIYQKKKR